MEIEPGIYRHYKGNEYEVIGIGKHSETLEDLVVYKALYATKRYATGSLWVRPAKMFKELVTVAGAKVPRFKKIHVKEGE